MLTCDWTSAGTAQAILHQNMDLPNLPDNWNLTELGNIAVLKFQASQTGKCPRN